MGIFGNSSPFDEDVEKATSENNTSEQWGLIMEICDRAGAAGGVGARDCLRAAMRRLAHPDPHVALQAATLLDACVANCGRAFLLEVASRDFEAEFRRVLARAQPPVAARLRALLRKWAEGEFRDDPQLDLIPALHARLRGGEGAPSSAPAPAAAVTAASSTAAAAERREQDELARAIALSLQEAPLYPRVDAPTAATAAAPAPAPPAALRQVRALYDFEAAEDNELTFLAGELVQVTDASDPNWWKGFNERGEGLFPANFVTADLSEPPPAPSGPVREGVTRLASLSHSKTRVKSRDVTRPTRTSPLPQETTQFSARSIGRERVVKSVQFAEEASGAGGGTEEVPSSLEPGALDAALAALHDASPEAAGADEPALLARERAALAQGPLIDAALERADRRHARLTALSAELVDALNLYHELMREPLKALLPPPPGALPPPPPPPPAMHHYYPGGASLLPR